MVNLLRTRSGFDFIYNRLAINPRNKKKSGIEITNAIEIQIGESTHHQDQVIVPINFKTINTMVNSPANPIPFEFVVVFFVFIFFCLF